MVRAKAPDVCAHYLIIKKQAIFVVLGESSKVRGQHGAVRRFPY
jgi:hypothetical protein